jgi:hypothetical protein
LPFFVMAGLRIAMTLRDKLTQANSSIRFNIFTQAKGEQ